MEAVTHGSESMYVKGCRCDPCREGRYHRVKRQQAYRRTGDVLVDATRAKAHLQTFVAEGFGITPMLRVAGWAIGGWHLDRTEFIHRRFERRILALTRAKLFAKLPEDSLVPSVGTIRRVRALQALGWSLTDITPGSSIARGVTRGPGILIAAKSYRLIAARYEQLCMTPGPSRSAALRSNRVTPLMWDDIDDPNEKPWRAPWSGKRSAVRPEDVERMLDSGMNLRSIAEKLHVEKHSVYRQLSRVGRTDLSERLARRAS